MSYKRNCRKDNNFINVFAAKFYFKFEIGISFFATVSKVESATKSIRYKMLFFVAKM